MLDLNFLSKEGLAALFDHTNLKPYATTADMEKLCREAAEYGFAMVAVNSCQTACCKRLLAGTAVHVGAAISFPLGQTSIPVKAFEAREAISSGADEIDYAVNLTQVKEGNWAYVQREMEELVSLCREQGVISKVIFENCYLEKWEIDRLSALALQVRPDFIKTSTGFGSGGATAEDVRRMKDIVGNAVKVKAAGGIRTWAACRDMLLAGADRIGSSAGLQILAEFERERA